MKFSVIVPVYNGEMFLQDALDSLAAQTFDDFEVVIVNDGSTDGTSTIADRFYRTHDRVKVIHKENEGLLFGRYSGISIAEGEYVVFLDADDAFRKDALSILADAVKTAPDMVQFKYSLKSDYSDSLPNVAYPLPTDSVEEQLRVAKSLLCSCRINSIWSKAIRRSLLLEFDYSSYGGLMHGEDLLQCAFVADKMNSCAFVNEPLYWYRPNDASSTRSFKAKQVEDLDIVSSFVLAKACEWGNEEYEVAKASLIKQYCGLVLLLSSATLGKREKRGFARLLKESVDARFTKADRKSPRLSIVHKAALSYIDGSGINPINGIAVGVFSAIRTKL